ncbi:MAG: flagellar export chaperone FliS [Planctomycetaceae bacterium]|jgi:flagellar protein FliS|nr:flagellar export chaperone FliS [Planctomycetaceae bacterium]
MQKNNTARNNYLMAEVSTATPQKLQLLLVEAAIKNINRTKQAWKDSRFDVGIESLTLAQDIVSEILCSLDMEGNPSIAKQLASIYLFIFRRLTEGSMWRDESKLDDALRVLNSERETWQQVCEKFGSTTSQTNNTANNNNSSSKNEAAEFKLSSNCSSKSINVTNNVSGKAATSSGGYSKPQSFPSGLTTFAKPSNSNVIQTVSFTSKPIQSDANLQQVNSPIKKPLVSGIQINESLAAMEQKTTQQSQQSQPVQPVQPTQQPIKPISQIIRPNPYK